MGVGQLDALSRRLISHGRAPDTPFALIENGSRPEQRVLSGAVKDLPDLARAHGIRSPALLIVGEVAGLASRCNGAAISMAARAASRSAWPPEAAAPKRLRGVRRPDPVSRSSGSCRRCGRRRRPGRCSRARSGGRRWTPCRYASGCLASTASMPTGAATSTSADFLAAGLLQQVDGGDHGAAGGQHGIDDQGQALVQLADQAFQVGMGFEGFLVAGHAHHALAPPGSGSARHPACRCRRAGWAPR